MIFDSHFHITSMNSRGLDTTLPSSFFGLECGTEPGDAEERIKLIGKRLDVMRSMGAGPWMLEKEGSIDIIIENLKKDIDRFGADAIGECGFDKHWNYGTIEKQRELFFREIMLIPLSWIYTFFNRMTLLIKNCDSNTVLEIKESSHVEP